MIQISGIREPEQMRVARAIVTALGTAGVCEPSKQTADCHSKVGG